MRIDEDRRYRELEARVDKNPADRTHIELPVKRENELARVSMQARLSGEIVGLKEGIQIRKNGVLLFIFKMGMDVFL